MWLILESIIFIKKDKIMGIIVLIVWLIWLSIIILSLVIGWRIMTATERIADAIENKHLREEAK
jgi:hypothetical protein